MSRDLNPRIPWRHIQILYRKIAALADSISGGLVSHAASHQNGGTDEISVAGLSGVLADPQTVDTDVAGALDGDGSVGSPLAVRVDGLTIQINVSNELEVVGGASLIRTVIYELDGGGSPLTGSFTRYVRVPFSGTITKWTLLADAGGSIVIDLWKDTFANYPPTNADSITAGNEPELSTDDEAEDSTLTGWTTSVTAGDVLGFTVDSVSGITWASLMLEITT